MLNGYISDLKILRDNNIDDNIFEKMNNYNNYYKTSKDKYITKLQFKDNYNVINLKYNDEVHVFEYNTDNINMNIKNIKNIKKLNKNKILRNFLKIIPIILFLGFIYNKK